jgi:hypothetical protein
MTPIQKVLIGASEDMYQFIKKYRTMKEANEGSSRGILTIKETTLLDKFDAIVQSTCRKYYEAKKWEDG